MATNSDDESSLEIRNDVSTTRLVALGEDESVDVDNDAFYCENCKSSFNIQCEVHGPPAFVRDFKIPIGFPQRALLTLPTGLLVGRSKAREGSLGIFSQGQEISVGLHFGPFDGEVVSREEALKSANSWVISKGGNQYEFIDGSRDSHSNWMRFVACARNKQEQNLVAFQQGGQLLFRCCSPILPGQELLVWYSEEYTKGLGLIWDQLWDNKLSSADTNTDIDASQERGCPFCRFSFPSQHYLLRHVSRTHSEQYPSFLENHPDETGDPKPVRDQKILLLGSEVPNTTQTEPTISHVQWGSHGLVDQMPSHLRTSANHLPSSRESLNDTYERDGSRETTSSLTLPLSHSSTGKPYNCSRCGRGFARMYHLKRHEPLHAPEKLYWIKRKVKRKPPNPRRHRQAADTEELAMEEEVRPTVRNGGDDNAERSDAAFEVYPCVQCFVAFMTRESLQEHLDQHSSVDGGSIEESNIFNSKLGSEQGSLNTNDTNDAGLSSAQDVFDPSDPPYEPLSCEQKKGKKILSRNLMPKRRRGRPRTRVPGQTKSTLACPEVEDQCEDPTEIIAEDVAAAKSRNGTPEAQTGSPETGVACTTCQCLFSDLVALQSHNCTPPDKGPYVCPQCNLHFKQESNMRRHQRSVHGLIKPYCCDLCGKFYTQITGLRRHLDGKLHKRRLLACSGKNSVTPRTDVNMYSCNFCEFSFTTRFYLRKHIKRHHPAEFVQIEETLEPQIGGSGEDGQEVQGSEDGRLIRTTRGALLSQTCPKCKKVFITLKGYKSHHCFLRSDRNFQCQVCGKQFTGAYSLRQHERTHTGERPYPCPHCSKSFTVAGQLMVHLRTHTGERPYLCSKCGQAFRQSGDLRRHEQKHLGVRLHHCPHCPKAFSRPQSLRAHQQIHSGVRLFHCQHCLKGFTRGYHLTRHLHKMHSSEATCGQPHKDLHQTFT